MRIIPFTKRGFKEIEEKLEALTIKRPQAVAVLKRAREMGDLSENGLYKAAKFELSDIDREIRNLKYLLKSAKIYSPEHNEFIQIGHKIKIKNEKIEKEYLIVGEFEANPSLGKISNKSPFGYALMGKKIGETAQIKTPTGIVEYIVISIE